MQKKSKPQKKANRIGMIQLNSLEDSGVFTATAFFSDKGERMTKIEHQAGEVLSTVQSVDQLMHQSASSPYALMNASRWNCLLPWLESDPENVRNFWTAFNNAEAEQARILAVLGPKMVHRMEEFRFLNLVSEYEYAWYGEALLRPYDEDYVQGELPPKNPRIPILKDKIVNWIVAAINQDEEALKRVSEVVTHWKSAESNLSHLQTLNGRVFTSFLNYVINHLELPTKKTVRKAANLGDEAVDFTACWRALDKLGLSGLPQG